MKLALLVRGTWICSQLQLNPIDRSATGSGPHSCWLLLGAATTCWPSICRTGRSGRFRYNACQMCSGWEFIPYTIVYCSYSELKFKGISMLLNCGINLEYFGIYLFSNIWYIMWYPRLHRVLLRLLLSHVCCSWTLRCLSRLQTWKPISLSFWRCQLLLP